MNRERYLPHVPDPIGPAPQPPPSIGSIAGLTAALAGKSDIGHGHAQSEVTGLVSALAGKAATSHTHSQSEVTNLVADLAGKAAAGHMHSIANVSGLQAALDAKAPVASASQCFVKPQPSTSFVEWPAMPPGPEFFLNVLSHNSILRLDLTGRTQIRVLMHQQGAAATVGSKLFVRWAAGPGNPPTSAGGYSNLGTGSDELFADITPYSTSFVVSPWLTLKADARVDTYLALIGQGGDYGSSPRFGYIGIEYR